jgi:gamma-glutamyltranspeptidase / glutathione hydrolase
MKYSENFDSFPSRSPVYSTKGIVAASQPLAVAAGLEILRKGGNAADAAVATAAALNVTEPTSTGIGGDCFALYYEHQSGAIYALNGSGRSPKSLNIERVEKDGFFDEIPPHHAYNVTVPGACAGWCDLTEKHGNLSIKDNLTPAIRLAEEGFPVAPITAYFWERGVEKVLKHSPGGFELTINGRSPKAGEIFRNPGLARTFNIIAEQGKETFYEGEIAEAITKVVQEAGGCLTEEDLYSHYSTWEEPISATYRDLRIWECPPNGQGLTALIALNILEGFDLSSLAPLSPERLHLEIESLRLAFADTRYYVSDPDFSSIPMDELLSKSYAQHRRKLINLKEATLTHQFGNPASSSDTVYLSVVDSEGNACSFINSNYMGFGTGIVPKGWGFSLQNRGYGFSLDRNHPNKLAPCKRPYHTIIPALATRSRKEKPGEELIASFGVMGGFMQPQGHVQVVVNLVDDNYDPQKILDQPRFCITDGSPDGLVALEEGIPIKSMSTIAEMGHPVMPVSDFNRAIFGRGQIILRDPVSGVNQAGSDPRADGCAMSY